MTGIKTFTATKSLDREALGDRVTEWLRKEKVTPVRVDVCQSSDSEYHCLSIVVIW